MLHRNETYRKEIGIMKEEHIQRRRDKLKERKEESIHKERRGGRVYDTITKEGNT